MRRAVVTALVLAIATPAAAQVVELKAGTSSLFRADGASVHVTSGRYEFVAGAGAIAGRAKFGMSLRTRVKRVGVAVGDETLSLQLPTDIFDSHRVLLARGAGISFVGTHLSLAAFAGAASSIIDTPFFRAADADRRVGSITLAWRASKTLSFTSRAVVADKRTALAGLEWTPSKMIIGGTAGVGANHRYLAASIVIERPRLSLKLAYASASDDFRRLTPRSPLTTDTNGERLLMTARPTRWLSLTVGREHFDRLDAARIAGVANRVGTSLQGGPLRINAALHEFHSGATRGTGRAASIGWKVNSRLEAVFAGFMSRGDSRATSAMASVAIREVLSRRIKLLQIVTRAGGRQSIAYGGEFVSNLGSINLDYQTTCVPSFTGPLFTQSVVISLRVQPFGNHYLNARTSRAPDGLVKYTAYVGTFLYGEASAPPARAAHRFAPHVLEGRVVDTGGAPVSGAAVRVDADTLFTDSDGRFLLRTSKQGSHRLAVRVDEFLMPGQFEVVSAPTTISTTSPSQPLVTIVVQRVLRK